MSTPETGHNSLLTRDEFLHRVLYSGELTQVAQHIALVIFLVAEGRNQLKLSLRDLERITGWDRRAIKEHVDELEIFMRVTFQSGRAKAIWELQGVLEDAIAAAVVAGAGRKKRKAAAPVVAQHDDHNSTSSVVEHMDDHNAVVEHLTDHKSPKGVVAHYVPTNNVVAHHVATSIMIGAAGIAATSPVVAHDMLHKSASPPVVAQHMTTTSEVAPSIERESLSNSNISFSVESYTPRAREDQPDDDGIKINGVAIYGPGGLKLPFAAIDQAAMLIGMPKERARAIAEVCARGWAANGEKVAAPMAKVTAAIRSDFNQGQIQDVRMEKARAEAKPKESRAARLLRHVEDAAEKGGRS